VTVGTLVPLVSALKMSLLVLLAFVASAIELVLAIHRTNRRAEQGRQTLANAVLASLDNPNGPGASGLPDELRPIAVALSDSIAQLHDAKARQRAHQALNDLAAQVAHDVRSPLAALSAVAPDFYLLPGDSGALARAAINRINEIANDLLRKYRDVGPMPAKDRPAEVPKDDAGIRQKCNVADIVNEIIQEKRLLLRSKPDIKIATIIAPAARGRMVCVAPSDLKRTISNLINNSVEALNCRGVVHIQLQALEDQVVLQISDNGPGIPPDVVPKLGEKGFSFGKTGGSGLGLHHARSVVRQCGGNLSIVSAQGRGTRVEVFLPASPTLALAHSPMPRA
jgi:signal transduction histidine kinase